MKPSFALIALGIFLGSIHAGDFGIGIKGGLSIHKLRLTLSSGADETVLSYNYHLGPAVACIGEKDNTNYFGQQICLGYFQAGGVASLPEMNGVGREIGRGQNTFTLDYSFVSYSTKWKYDITCVTAYLLLGIQFDYLIDFNDRYRASDNKTYELQSFKYSTLEKSNITPMIGIGAVYRIQSNKFFIEYLPYFHLLPFFKHAKTSENSGAWHTTSGHVIDIGLIHDL